MRTALIQRTIIAVAINELKQALKDLKDKNNWYWPEITKLEVGQIGMLNDYVIQVDQTISDSEAIVELSGNGRKLKLLFYEQRS